jgi:hypothetical protein
MPKNHCLSNLGIDTNQNHNPRGRNIFKVTILRVELLFGKYCLKNIENIVRNYFYNHLTLSHMAHLEATDTQGGGERDYFPLMKPHLGIWKGVWEGVAMDSLKFHLDPPSPTLLLSVAQPQNGLMVSGVAHLQGVRPAAVFYPFGHPMPIIIIIVNLPKRYPS